MNAKERYNRLKDLQTLATRLQVALIEEADLALAEVEAIEESVVEQLETPKCCDESNNPVIPDSCEPEKRYRDVTPADIGEKVWVRHFDQQKWISRELLDCSFGLFFCKSPSGKRTKWKFARIEVTE